MFSSHAGAAAQAAVTPLDISFIDQNFSVTDQSVFNFTLNIGAAAANRIVIVGAGGRKSSGAGRVINSVTVGGITATQIAQVTQNGANSNVAGIFAAAVPTGTSAAVIVTYSGTMDRSHTATFRMLRSSVTASDSGTDTGASPLGTTLNVPANGAIMGVVGYANEEVGYTWSGADEDYDEYFTGRSGRYSGASRNFAAAASGHVIQATSSNTIGAFAAAAWGPG